MKEQTLSMFNRFTPERIAQIISYYNKEQLEPVMLCIGSDLVLGDCLGPIIGSKIKDADMRRFVYGTLRSPITAREIAHIDKLIVQTHKSAFFIAIDAAIGKKDDVGLIKIADGGLRPGLGVQKQLPTIGNIGIMGVVSERSENNDVFYNGTRLNFIYKMASVISSGINTYFNHIERIKMIV